MKRPENLAPAGSREALDRAVAGGADAVYLGYSAFNARAGAANFDEAGLREAIAFAHLYHVRVHVTLNTLIKDGELPAVYETLRLLNELPADAVLIQDLGVLALARSCFPALPVHASTQMAIHNAAGARWCAGEGMRRVVLARECSLSEISLAAKEAIEIEVFSHGAQCVAVSGQCLFSSMVGGRSGNRGRCAQPCRMTYDYRGERGAWLSPRDVCLRPQIDRLIRAGVASLKIEGRLKRPEYVAVTAASYRRGLDGEALQPGETDALRQVFHRGGFMRGYALGAEDADVIDPARVNHGGLPLGRVERADRAFARVRLTRELHDGDGLQFRTASGDEECTYAGHETPAGELAVIRLRPGMQVRPGDAVFRLADEAQLSAARALPLPAIPADGLLYAAPGEPLSLTLNDGEVCVTVTGETALPAERRALTAEEARRSLGKTGGTPFVLRELTLEGDGAFVPVSALNSLRREALERLQEARTAAFAAAKGPALPMPEAVLPAGTLPETVLFRTAEQFAAIPASARAVWDPEDWRPAALEAGLAALPQGVWLQLPTVCEEATLRAIHAFVHAHREHLGGVVLGNVGQLGLRWELPYGAGSGIPVMNRRAAAFLLARGCAFVTASAELSRAETEVLCAGAPPILVPVYGRVQLMLLHHCPARTRLGLTEGHAFCRLCDAGSPDALRGTALTDRTGASFPLQRVRLPEGCLVRLLNALPTALRPLPGMAGAWTLTDETAAEAQAVMAALTDGAALPFRTTSGHEKRPVE